MLHIDFGMGIKRVALHIVLMAVIVIVLSGGVGTLMAHCR